MPFRSLICGMYADRMAFMALLTLHGALHRFVTESFTLSVAEFLIAMAVAAIMSRYAAVALSLCLLLTPRNCQTKSQLAKGARFKQLSLGLCGEITGCWFLHRKKLKFRVLINIKLVDILH